MANKNGGFIGTDGLDAPDPPTAVTPTAAGGQVSVAFTAPTDTGTSAITGFVVQVSTNGTDYSAGSNTGTSSPIVVSSLTNGTAQTAKVWAINAYGTSAPSDASSSFTPLNNRGIFIGGDAPSNVMDYITISTDGNATDFGDLLSATGSVSNGAAASFTRGVVTGGLTGSGNINVIQYVTIASTGNATDFGDMTNVYANMGGHSSTTRGVYGGGQKNSGSNASNVIEYITIANTGDATDFGDLLADSQFASALGSSSRAVFKSQNNSNVIEYITIASTGNSTDFGNSTQSIELQAAASSGTRGIFAGGYVTSGADFSNVMDYITIASTGNASDFGDLTQAVNGSSAVSDSTKWVRGGGSISGSTVNVMDDVTIASTGNAADFGNLTSTRGRLGCTCGSHGGLQ